MSELHLNICQSDTELKFIGIEADSFYWQIVSIKSEKNTHDNTTLAANRKTLLRCPSQIRA